jgi:hypothetical protein
VKIDDTMDCRQPQPRASLFGGKERKEYFTQIVLRDAFSGILK